MRIPIARNGRKVPATPLLVASVLSAGVGTAMGQAAVSWVSFAGSVAALLTGTASLLLLGARLSRARGPTWASCLLLVALLAGLVNGFASRPRSGHGARESDHGQITGAVIEVQYLHWGRRVVVRAVEAAGEPARRTIRLTLPETAPALRPGDLVSGSARFGPPEPPRNPGGLDFATLMHRRGIEATGRFLEVTRTASGPMTMERRLDLRRGEVRLAAARAAQRAWPVDRADEGALEGVLRALSLGEGAAVPPALRQSFATAGLAHLLAVSGLHIGLVAAGLFGFSRWLLLRLPGARSAGPVAAVMVAPVVGLLVAWVGHPPSAARAGTMAVVLLGAAALRRRLCGWSSLSVAAVALLVLQPELSLRPGFQLSFAAVAGLLAIAGRRREQRASPTSRRVFGERARQMGLVTLAAALATAPLCAIHFGLVPLAGNLANLVAVPMTGLLVPLVALATCGTLLAGEAADPLWAPAALIGRLLLEVAEVAASLPFASAPARSPGALAILASVAGLCISIRVSGALRRAAASAVVVLPLILPCHIDRGTPPAAPLEVVFLSVGHGDATLIRTASKDMLVDAGQSSSGGIDAGSAHVVPALRALGVRRLAAVLVTHPHDDHYGGMFAVLDSFPVERFLHTGLGGSDDEAYSELLARAAEVGASIQTACRDPLPDMSPARLECLHPNGEGDGGSYLPLLSANDNSVVLAAALGRVRFLLTGDIEAEAEGLLLAQGVDLTASVVKAGHHGSRSSSTPPFVAATLAEHVVFSAGRPGRRFDFPATEVVARWAKTGAALWWTQHHGAIHFLTNGETLRVRPFREEVADWPPSRGAPATASDARESGQ